MKCSEIVLIVSKYVYLSYLLLIEGKCSCHDENFRGDNNTSQITLFKKAYCIVEIVILTIFKTVGSIGTSLNINTF